MPLRVMIVEDEPVIALDLQSIVEDAGHQVVGIAASMEDALTVATAAPPPNLAIMDVDLAGGADGVQTAQRLREDHNVASLFVSASLTAAVRVRAAALRPVDFMGKPYQEQQILAAIDRFVRTG